MASFALMRLTPQHVNGSLSGTGSWPLSLLPQKDQPPPGKNNFWIQFLFSRREGGVEATLRAGDGGQVRITDHRATSSSWDADNLPSPHLTPAEGAS